MATGKVTMLVKIMSEVFHFFLLLIFAFSRQGSVFVSSNYRYSLLLCHIFISLARYTGSRPIPDFALTTLRVKDSILLDS